MHSFIIKLRFEKDLGDGGPTTCHGYITHVPGGEQGYLRDLDGVAAFIMPYLEASGVRVGLCWRVSRWFRSWRGRPGPAAGRDR